MRCLWARSLCEGRDPAFPPAAGEAISFMQVYLSASCLAVSPGSPGKLPALTMGSAAPGAALDPRRQEPAGSMAPPSQAWGGGSQAGAPGTVEGGPALPAGTSQEQTITSAPSLLCCVLPKPCSCCLSALPHTNHLQTSPCVRLRKFCPAQAGREGRRRAGARGHLPAGCCKPRSL